jgi:hypothetical protein
MSGSDGCSYYGNSTVSDTRIGGRIGNPPSIVPSIVPFQSQLDVLFSVPTRRI